MGTKVTQKFNYTGANQTFTIPNVVSNVFIQVWGAAGGSQLGLGGPGGYSQGYLNVSPGDLLTVIVGQGGINQATSQTACLLTTYGGGGGGGPCTEIYKGSSAGGRSAVRLSNGTEVITAGGGGGSSSSYSDTGYNIGGAGGGTVGSDGYVSYTCYNIAMGKGGTQSAGGSGGSGWTTFNNGGAGSSFLGGVGGGGSNGGTSAGSAGGGGGGYFGGGGGAGEYQAGLGCPISAGAQDCSGGGGSGYIGGVTSGLTLATTLPTTYVSPINPPFTTDPNYVSGIGASKSGVGGNGLAVFSYTIPTLTKSVNKSIATIGDVLTYTLVLDNTSGVTINNITLVDTIPNGTTFVNNSLTVNNAPISGNPNPPGVNIGNISTVVTITFNVLVTTVPTPNPIANTATISGDNLSSTNSNTVSTKINYIQLSTSKIVNKAYANIGDILTYTIPILNSGNTSVNSIVFIDTIPNGTIFIANSLKQDGAIVSGSSNPPGVTLPNSIGISRVSTVTFQVQVITLPCPNPIPNTASMTSTYTVDSTTTPNITSKNSINTNTVNTQINNASLGNIAKYTDKSYANCGDIVTYTIAIPNSGNVTAQNIIFKDTIPSGTIFVTNSVIINGSQQSGANPSTGITIPNISPGATSTLTFKVQVQC